MSHTKLTGIGTFLAKVPVQIPREKSPNYNGILGSVSTSGSFNLTGTSQNTGTFPKERSDAGRLCMLASHST